MKIAHFADIHVSDARISEFERILTQLGTSIVEQGPDLIIFAGDMFIHRDKLSPKQVQLTRELFKSTLKEYKTIIIPGNHDVSMSELKINSLSAIFIHDDKIKVYTEIGSYIDIENYRFHMFGYPSKKELVRLGITNISELYSNQEVFDLFDFAEDKHNVLLYHGTLEGFNVSDYIASEEAIGVGKDLIIPKVFWAKFDAVFAGHLHKYQGIDKAIYPGCPAPLTFADAESTGWVLWDDLNPTFMVLNQLYPYQTVDIGDLSIYKNELTQEAARRIENDLDYTDTRIRIKYKIYQTQTGEVDHAVLSSKFKNALDIKIVPKLASIDRKKGVVSFDDFQHHTIKEIIFKYIDEKKFNPDVKTIGELVESRLKTKYSIEEEKGINFKPCKLNILNFKCFGTETPELDFTKLDKVVGIFGSNQTGKSSLVEAIVWALFGTTLRNKDIKSVIRNGQKRCQVTLEFISHMVTYKVERDRTFSGSVVKLFKRADDDWIDISGADNKGTQGLLEELVGTFDIFISTVYSPQNKINLLIEKKPLERKKIILDCLQIDVLSRRIEEITLIRKEAKSKVDTIRGKVQVYSEQLKSLINSKPQEMLHEFTMLLNNEKIVQSRFLTHIEALSKKLHSYEDLKIDHDELNNKAGKLKKEIDELDLKLFTKKQDKLKMQTILEDKSAIDKGMQRLRDYAEKIERYKEENTRNIERRNRISLLRHDDTKVQENYKNSMSIVDTSKNAIVNQIENKQALDCSSALCPINKEIQEQKDSLRIALDELNEQAAVETHKYELEVNAIREQIITIEEIINTSFFDTNKHMEYMRMHKKEQAHKWPELEYQISSGVNILDSFTELILAYERQFLDFKNQRREVAAKRGVMAEKIASIDRYNSELKDTRLDLSECNKQITNFETQIYKHTKNLEDITELQKEVDRYNKRLTKGEKYLVHCARYNDIVGKSGVVFRIVDKALPIIEKFSQDLLGETTNGSISVYIDSYKTLSGGGNKDEVSIYIADSKGKRDVLEASGAETVLVSLALRAAMAHLLSLRMGSSVELFIIDEGMGALDDENIVVIKNMFKKLGDIFNKVLFITHVSELKDIAQSVIEVTSNSKVSTFKVVEAKDNE